MNPSPIESFKRLQRYDDRRPGFQGEHWLVLGAGAALLLASRRSPSPLRRTVGSALGSALLVRAASGRQGLASVLRYLPLGRRW
ncbi:hypothetical protein AVMA1855_10355 [Acidovorax sp. SUPP1855]|uniref:hypothetical protein n=1 Tax=unclassified Acidovorax TaxID=2684926 RepID=UPI0023DE6501|nr:MULTISPECIES: hypothetical protein [Comamonadaceae]WOI44755.1 hypothetical protein R1Z03_19865 [Paracidovorax avenae]GKS84545.1 hypothetical protein AVMA1855_10355 [Acidovorax sp. SUPP1855]GKS98434.1 hypothetical protein AVKW3434_03620 [Acidovorax sp. SUPP3434]